MKPTRNPVGIAYVGLIYLFFYLPIIVLIALSFNSSQYSMVWHGFSWQWYQQLFTDSDLWTAAWHSLILGVLAATIASFLGLLAAVSLYRYRFFGKNFLHGLIFILIVSPDIVTGTSLLILYSFIQLNLGFWTLLLAHITLCIPFVAITVFSRISTLDKHIFEAAKDLGANDFMIFFRIMIPLLMPGILAGWLLSFSLSLDDVIISYFVAGPSFQILPLEIFSMVKLGVNPEVNALCTVLFAITIILVTASQLLNRKSHIEK